MGKDILFFLFYVDDILVIGSHSSHIKVVIQKLNSEYVFTYPGDFNCFLIVKVTKSMESLHLSQTKYIRDILKKTICWTIKAIVLL